MVNRPKTPACAARRVAPSRSAAASPRETRGQPVRSAFLEPVGLAIERGGDSVVGSIARVLARLVGHSDRPLDPRLLDADRLADRLTVIICSGASDLRRTPTEGRGRHVTQDQSRTRSSSDRAC